MRLFVALLLLPVLSLSARQSQFAELPSYPLQPNPQSTVGNYEILIHVDGEAFLYVQDARLKYLPLSGAPIRDAGTNYTQAIPRRPLSAFRMLKKAGRGDVSLHEEPKASNDYTAIIRVNDRDNGSDFYHIHLDWTWGAPEPQPTGRGRGGPDVRDDRRDNPPFVSNPGPGRSGTFEYRGNVDESSVVIIRGNQVREEDLFRRAIRGSRLSLSRPLPSEYVRVLDLVDVSGRGEIELVEKPWEGNDYTAVVRIVDPQRGSAPYSFRLVWSR
jgi:hypothetical protein